MLKKIIYSIIAFSLTISFANFVHASSPFMGEAGNKLLTNTGVNTQEAGTQELVAERIGETIKMFLSFLGILILIIIIYAGVLWLTAGGNADQVEKAKKWLFNSVIGALIIGLAYAIAAFILYLT